MRRARACIVISLALTFSAGCGSSGDDPAAAAGSGGSAASSGSGAGAAAGTAGASSGGGAGNGGAASCPATPIAAGDHDETMSSSGRQREYRLHVPPSYDPTRPAMLVFILHGYTETNSQIEITTGMTPISDEKGFLLVYPQGIGDSWSAGKCCGSGTSTDYHDTQFVSEMIDAVSATACVDPKRVFVGGFSNGGMMSQRIACELSERIAAIGPVSGTLGIDTCAPARPVPVIEFHGTSDIVVPYTGLITQSVDATIKKWVAIDGCSDGTPATVYQKGIVTCTEYSACSAGTAVELCKIQGGGHAWPDGQPDGIGLLTHDINASRTMIAFFEQHPTP